MAETKHIEASIFRRSLGDFVDSTLSSGARFIYTRWGRPKAALVSLADLDKLEALERGKK